MYYYGSTACKSGEHDPRIPQVSPIWPRSAPPEVPKGDARRVPCHCWGTARSDCSKSSAQILALWARTHLLARGRGKQTMDDGVAMGSPWARGPVQSCCAQSAGAMSWFELDPSCRTSGLDSMALAARQTACENRRGAGLAGTGCAAKTPTAPTWCFPRPWKPQHHPASRLHHHFGAVNCTLCAAPVAAGTRRTRFFWARNLAHRRAISRLSAGVPASFPPRCLRKDALVAQFAQGGSGINACKRTVVTLCHSNCTCQPQSRPV